MPGRRSVWGSKRKRDKKQMICCDWRMAGDGGTVRGRVAGDPDQRQVVRRFSCVSCFKQSSLLLLPGLWMFLCCSCQSWKRVAVVDFGAVVAASDAGIGQSEEAKSTCRLLTGRRKRLMGESRPGSRPALTSDSWLSDDPQASGDENVHTSETCASVTSPRSTVRTGCRPRSS